MFNTLTELFLQTYFTFDIIAGKLSDNKKSMFDKIYDAFLLPTSERVNLFDLTECDEVREMETYSDYARVCRIKKYSEIAEIDSDIGADLSGAIDVKGEALRKIKQFGYEEFGASTQAAVCKLLTESANMGLIPSLCVLGFLQCEGIFVEKNYRIGNKNLLRAAKWNSLPGLMLALYYDKNSRNTNLDRLYTVTRGTLYEGLYSRAESVYSTTHTAHVLPETKMMAKAFGAGILKPDLYISQYSRFIYSDVLTLKDRERALFSGHKEVVGEIADLPLKLLDGKIEFDSTMLKELPLLRADEQGAISCIAMNSDMRKDSTYRPLCVSGDSDYILQLYLVAISKAFSSAHIERIDVADLNDYDFEPTKNNIFVRSCDEDRQNVYCLYLKGEIREPVLNVVKNFLRSDKRRKIRLQHPSAVLDLSSVLPVCFCDKQNAKLLKQYCDSVTIAPVIEAEKQDVITYILQTKSEKYGMNNAKIDSDAFKLLTSYTVDRAENMIDRAMRFHREADSLTITADILKALSIGEQSTKMKYGFGGIDSENK